MYTNISGQMEDVLDVDHLFQAAMEKLSDTEEIMSKKEKGDPTVNIQTSKRLTISKSLDDLLDAGDIFHDPEKQESTLKSPIWQFVRKIYWRNKSGKHKPCFIGRAQCTLCDAWISCEPPENLKGHFIHKHQSDIQHLEDIELKHAYCQWLNKPESWAFPEIQDSDDPKHFQYAHIPDITLKSAHPSPATLRALSWEGSFTPKYYKRV